VAVRTCSECGTQTESDWRGFCQACGTALPDHPQQPVSASSDPQLTTAPTPTESESDSPWHPLLSSDPTQIDDYRLDGRLGAGSFGVVYAATDADGSPVALKLLRPELSDDRRLRRRLAREAEALRRVEGDRTVKIIDVITEGDRAYLVMELLEGSTLDDTVKDQGPLQAGPLWFAAQGLIEALHDIRDAGVIHRDLKPSNVMYGPDGIKVLDFGISVVAEETSLTQTGAFMGTAAWISPEQITDDEITEATDVFNFGLVMAFAATGTHPFGEGRSDALMYRISSAEPDLSGVFSPVKEALEQCLQREPDARPSIAALAKFFNSDRATGLGTGVSDTVIVSPDALDTNVGIDSGSAGDDADRVVQPPFNQASARFGNRKIVAVWTAMIAVAAIAGIVISQDSDDTTATAPPLATSSNNEDERGADNVRSQDPQPDSKGATSQPCNATDSENKALTESTNIRYINVVPRADHTSSFLFDNLRYEGNNPEMRTPSPTADQPSPTAEEVAGRWRALIAKTGGMFVLRDSLFSQQDHPFKHGIPCALMMPPNWITKAVLTPEPKPMTAPPIDDESAWQETRGDPSTVFGSFEPSEDLHNYASQLSTDKPPALKTQILAARSTIRLLASFANELLQTREDSGIDAAIDHGADLIATSDNSYFGSVRAKAIPMMGIKPSEEDSISGMKALEDTSNQIIETVMRRRLDDGDLLLIYRYQYPFDLSSPEERRQALTTLSRVIPPSAPPGGVVWLWIWGGSDSDSQSGWDDPTTYIEIFKEELRSEEIDLSRLRFYAKPTSEYEGPDASDQFENELDRYQSFGFALSVNTDATGVKKWMRQR